MDWTQWESNIIILLYLRIYVLSLCYHVMPVQWDELAWGINTKKKHMPNNHQLHSGNNMMLLICILRHPTMISTTACFLPLRFSFASGFRWSTNIHNTSSGDGGGVMAVVVKVMGWSFTYFWEISKKGSSLVLLLLSSWLIAEISTMIISTTRPWWWWWW